ncbi:MAG TPA: transglycosylase domain-containing protein [Solirubrobacteraceae bacterium]|nr:transglycosylase domain-containing protein [Solirubrobacteraceae bacterium]
MTASERQRRRKARRKDPTRLILITGGALFGAIALMILAGAAVVAAIAHEVPPLKDLKPIVKGEASTVYYSDGSVAGLIPSTVLRTPIAYSQISPYVREGTIAIEDQRFWTTGAIDPLSLVRAAITDVTSGKTLQGGSTITMQLVRNLYLADDRTFKFKIKEAVIAERLEQAHSKKWILTSYLNYVPYGTVDGQTAEGVEAASWTFFDRPSRDDTLAQAALLAGLPQAPTDYNPFNFPAAAKQRRNEVLAKMAQLGYISPSRAATAERAGLELHPNHHYALGGSYVTDFIRAELIKRYGLKTLQDGGLRVYTTLSSHLGAIAKGAINGVLNLPGDPSASLVSEDPNNGYVDAMAQSDNYSQSQYNLATQAQRQPGSTFKAIVLADALAHGIDPFTTDYLSHTLQAGWISSAPTYTVTIDSGGSLNADLNLDEALVQSDNTVFAQLAADLTETSVTKMAYAMGVLPGTLHSYPAEALGGLTVGVTPLEMANVYSTIADGGYRNKQITIKKVVFPDGRVDSSWGVPHRVQVLSTAAALVETEILQHNVQYGTATLSAIACPSAAKTGTTSKLVDAWLDGFTPNRTTVVWMGYPNANISMNDVHGQPQFGGLLPAQIWHNFMATVVTPPCTPFAAPASDPMSYLPFSGTYQRAGQAAYIPPSTGASGATGAGKAGRGNGGTHAPAVTQPQGGAQAPTNTPASTTTPANTTPATPPPPSPGGAQAPTGTT